MSLFRAAGDHTCPPGLLTELLATSHYLGPRASAQFGWRDEYGAMVFSNPAAGHLPQDWLELSRWCLTGGPGSGSRQWASFARYARRELKASTIVSYSDPAQGHDGALYRACGWLWAPTWHRLRPPPSGHGSWRSRHSFVRTPESERGPKDRWVFPLAPDERRQAALSLQDEACRKRWPWAEYREPKWRGGRFDPRTGGGDFKRWRDRADG